MTAHTRPGRRIGWGITGLAATVAVVTAAPAASAEVRTLSIYPADQTFVAGTSYQLYASTSGGVSFDWLNFYDNGQCIGGAKPKSHPDLELPPRAAMSWIPSTAGRHVITVDDGTTTKSLTLDVQPAPAGSTPATPGPKPAGCGALDRLIGTGSAALGR